MLLVAITGPVGSDKTGTLRRFASNAMASGASVDGFVSVAGIRPIADKGATSYTLLWVKSEEETLFASRDPQQGFVLDPSTQARLVQWSQELASQDVIVMDEFGKWEAQGNGLIGIWPDVLASRPRMIVVTLREGVQAEVEHYLGKKFDLVLTVGDGCVEKLSATLDELRDWERIGVYGAGSGGIEWSVGSWLHATKFPFTGTVMGALQASVLAIASEKIGRKSLTVWVSLISAGIKATSPAGAQITPTIAITMQGFLFTLGAMTLRWSRAGIALGAFLVGVWAAFQGFFIQYLLLGKSLEKVWDAGIQFLAKSAHVSLPNFWIFAFVLAVVNGGISAGLTLAVTGKSSRHREKLEQMLKLRTKQVSQKRLSVFADLKQPIFWLPLVIVSVILFYAKEQPTHIAWMVIRAVAVILALGGVFRMIRVERVFDWLARRGHWGPVTAMKAASEKPSSQRE